MHKTETASIAGVGDNLWYVPEALRGRVAPRAKARPGPVRRDTWDEASKVAQRGVPPQMGTYASGAAFGNSVACDQTASQTVSLSSYVSVCQHATTRPDESVILA